MLPGKPGNPLPFLERKRIIHLSLKQGSNKSCQVRCLDITDSQKKLEVQRYIPSLLHIPKILDKQKPTALQGSGKGACILKVKGSVRTAASIRAKLSVDLLKPSGQSTLCGCQLLRHLARRRRSSFGVNGVGSADIY